MDKGLFHVGVPAGGEALGVEGHGPGLGGCGRNPGISSYLEASRLAPRRRQGDLAAPRSRGFPASSASAGSRPARPLGLQQGNPSEAGPRHPGPARTPPVVRRCSGGAPAALRTESRLPGTGGAQAGRTHPDAAAAGAAGRKERQRAAWGPPRLPEEAPERRLRPRGRLASPPPA